VNQTDESDAPWVAIANAGNDRGQPVVVNRAGETVWWSSRQEGIVVTQLEPMEGGVRFLEQDLHREDPTASAIVTMDWLGQQEERIEISGAHHRFVSLDDGSMVALAVDVRDWTDPETGEDLQVVGDRLIAVSPEGDQEEIFLTWDVLEVTTDGFGGFYGDELDWTHGNSIWVDPTGETLLLTLGHLDSVLEIDRSTGALIRQIDAQSHVITEGTTEFGFPHDARWTDDGTLLLMTTDVFSFGVEYDIDAEAGSISEIRRIGDDVEIYAAALGEVQPMEHGGHLISYGMGGAIRELNQAGEVVWELWGKPGNDRLGSIRPFHSFAVSDDD